MNEQELNNFVIRSICQYNDVTIKYVPDLLSQGQIHLEDKEIVIQRKNVCQPDRSFTDETNIILHEFGHLIMCKDDFVSLSGYDNNYRKYQQPFKLLVEELLAWYYGFVFFYLLPIKLSIKEEIVFYFKFLKLFIDCYSSYIAYCFTDEKVIDNNIDRIFNSFPLKLIIK